MKMLIKPFARLLLGLAVLGTACKKPDQETPPPGTGNPVPGTVYQFKVIIDQLPGEISGRADLSAVISLQAPGGQTVIADQVLPLSYSGKYESASLELPQGNYRLVKLLVVQAGGRVLFATPHAGSARALLISKPLALEADLNSAGTNSLHAEVLRIGVADKAEDFGYAQGTFNNRPDEDDRQFTFTLQPLFRIGEVVYDSIPVSVRITGFSAQGTPVTTVRALPAGPQQITLSKDMARYELSISKWGIADQLVITQAEMNNGAKFSIGGARAARKLKSESVSKQSGNLWLADTRKEYQYDAQGRLLKVQHYRKTTGQVTVAAGTEELSYENGRVSKITTTGTDADKTILFGYNADGKIDFMRENAAGGQTMATVDYIALPGKTGISNHYRISAGYTFSQYYFTQHLNVDIEGGNAVRRQNVTSHGNAELADYSYDFGINPYIHTGLPDFWFSNQSKHNPLTRVASYSIIIPQYEPYLYSYVYDAEGYPLEVYTRYRVTGTQQDAFRTRTVFTYE